MQRKRQSNETIIIKTHGVGQSNTQYYRQYKQDALEQPSLVMYQLLRSIVRKQIRPPYQYIKATVSRQVLDLSQIQRRHTNFELQTVSNNITNVVLSIQTRFVIEGFLEIKNRYLQEKRARQDLQVFIQTLLHYRNSQVIQLKQQAFQKLYQYKRSIPSSLNQIQAMNSYIIHNNEEQSGSMSIIKRHKTRFTRQQGQQYESVQSHLQSHKYRANADEINQLQSKVFVTHHKNAHHQQHNQNHVFLIQDYRIKAKEPSNFIKIPISSQNVKILQTGRKSSNKKRIVRDEQQIQRQICQDCKYCRQKKQRQQMLMAVGQSLGREQA